MSRSSRGPLLGKLKSRNLTSPIGAEPVAKTVIYTSLDDLRIVHSAIEEAARQQLPVSKTGNHNGKTLAAICRAWLKGRSK
jgi:hypothetical protein